MKHVSTVYLDINMNAPAGGKPKIPPPIQFDGQQPPFTEWATEVRNNLSINGLQFTANMDVSYKEVNGSVNPVDMDDIYYNVAEFRDVIENIRRYNKIGTALVETESAKTNVLMLRSLGACLC